MPSDKYHEVTRMFRAAAGVALETAPATTDEVAAAQEALGVRFPESYVWFQLEFGRVPNGPLDIYTVRPTDPEQRNIVGINVDERTNAWPPLPVHLIAFSDSGGGDLLCFDTSALRDRECPVVWWDHELDDTQQPMQAASSFLEWIEAELRERAAEEPGSLLDALGHVHRAWLRQWFNK